MEPIKLEIKPDEYSYVKYVFLILKFKIMGRERVKKDGTYVAPSVSGKNTKRTGGQSNGGPGKNAQHNDGGHHSQIAKGQRGTQGPRK